MAEYRARIVWRRESADFKYDTYNRNHLWNFESGISITASAAPGFLGSPDRVDPEEAFVASISSCHMLTFLAICARRRIVVNAYEDRALGQMALNASGRLAVTRVWLANSVRTEIRVKGT